MDEHSFDDKFDHVFEKLDDLARKVEHTQTEFTKLKASLDKGWGIVIGVTATVGLFAEALSTDIVNGFKRFMGWP